MNYQVQAIAQTQQRASTVPSFNGDILQRQCACGQHTGGGECEECRKKREGTIQRATVSAAPVNSVPPIVNEVLSSSGQPLDAETRAFMEPRFGHDFSSVRVHTDARAAESARAVNALAYTVGRNVVFGKEQYAPGMSTGKRLLAHELTHVVQQKGTENTSHLQHKLAISVPESIGEREAEQVANQVISGTERLNRNYISTLSTLQRVSSDDCTFSDSECEQPDTTGSGTATDWKLVLSVDREQKGLGRLISGDVGHTWVKLMNNAGTKFSYGFWPQTGFKSFAPFLSVDGCVHHPDTAHEPPNATEYSDIDYKLTHQNYLNGILFAQSVCEAPPSYNLFTYNCTTFAINVAKAAGVSPPSSTTMAIDNPNALFEGIEEEQAKRGAESNAASTGSGSEGSKKAS